jgi:hypothetical protein
VGVLENGPRRPLRTAAHGGASGNRPAPHRPHAVVLRDAAPALALLRQARRQEPRNFFDSDHSSALALGETGVVLLVAPSQRQARVLLRYILGFLRSVPMLEAMIVRETEFAVELRNNITIEVRAADYKTIRNFTVIAALVDEISFLPQDDSAVPDTELLNAIRPAMGTIRNSLLICSSTPHAQRGELYRAYQAHFCNDDSSVAFFNASTLVANPAMDPRVVEQAFEESPEVAASEYGSGGFMRFRSDVERLISMEALDLCTDLDRPLILPPNFEEEAA